MSKSNQADSQIRTRDDFDVTSTDETMTIKPCNDVRIGDVIMIKDNPCKIVDFVVSKTGKHGEANHNFVGIDIFTKKKYETIIFSSKNVNVPIITKTSAILVQVEENDGSSPVYLSVLMPNGTIKNDLQVETEMGDQLREESKKKTLSVVIQSAIGKEMILSYKESTD